MFSVTMHTYICIVHASAFITAEYISILCC